jgi:hypothetical protein
MDQYTDQPSTPNPTTDGAGSPGAAPTPFRASGPSAIWPRDTSPPDNATLDTLMAKNSPYWIEGHRHHKAYVERVSALFQQGLAPTPEQTSKPAPTPKPQPTSTPGPSLAGKSVDTLRQHPAFWDANHPEHDKYVAAVRAIGASERTEAEVEAHQTAPVEDLRSMFQVTKPDMAPVFEKLWDTDTEACFLLFAEEQGIPNSVVRDLYEEYVPRAIRGMGRLSADDVVVLRDRFRGRLSEEQMDFLEDQIVHGGA